MLKVGFELFWAHGPDAVRRVASHARVVVAGEDVRDVRDACGDEFCLVVPGIRPAGGNGDDHVRVLTAAAAIEKGADYLIVGRPITGSDDPAGVARGIVLESR